MNDDRLTKKVFKTDLELHKSSKNWSSEIKQIMNDIGLSDQFESKSVINLSKVDEHLIVFYIRKWQEDVQHVPKLRTYKVFNLNLTQRSMSNSICITMKDPLCAS